MGSCQTCNSAEVALKPSIVAVDPLGFRSSSSTSVKGCTTLRVALPTTTGLSIPANSTSCSYSLLPMPSGCQVVVLSRRSSNASSHVVGSCLSNQPDSRCQVGRMQAEVSSPALAFADCSCSSELACSSSQNSLAAGT